MVIALEIALAPGEPCYQPAPGEEIEVRLSDVVSFRPFEHSSTWHRVRYLMSSAGAIFVQPLEPMSSAALDRPVTGIRPVTSPEPAVEIL